MYVWYEVGPTTQPRSARSRSIAKLVYSTYMTNGLYMCIMVHALFNATVLTHVIVLKSQAYAWFHPEVCTDITQKQSFFCLCVVCMHVFTSPLFAWVNACAISWTQMTHICKNIALTRLHYISAGEVWDSVLDLLERHKDTKYSI